MIYVILSSGFKKDSDTEFIKLLKIGYTNDDKKDRRYYQYISHNPTIKVLYEISEGTKETEDLLHAHFSKYRYSEYGKEWFEFDKEIVEFFETNKTEDDLLKAVDLDLKKRSDRYRFNGFNKYVYEIIDIGLNYKMTLDSSYGIDQAIKDREINFKEIGSSGLITKSGVYKTILKNLGIKEEEFEIYRNRDIPENIKKFIEDFNTLPGFYEKMKAICESDFSENERMMVLEQVPILYKNLYLQMGPERLKANSYNITFIKKEMMNCENNSNVDIKSEILKSFNIGYRYSLIEIKAILGNIYTNVSYVATPKASELSNYFELKPVKFFDNKLNKIVNGYEILKKKEL